MKILMNKKHKMISIIFTLIILLPGFLISCTKTNDDVMLKEAAVAKLKTLYDNLIIEKASIKPDPEYKYYYEDTSQSIVLPDISEFPFIVNPTTEKFITVYTTDEKTDWMTYIGNKFNQSGATVNGEPISVAIRAFKDSLETEFILSGKFTPDLLIPNSQFSADILTASNIKITESDGRILGNTGGLIVSNDSDLPNKYKESGIKSIIDAVMNEEITLGYKNPLTSESGFNFILAILSSFDSNPISETAANGLRLFQDNIQYIAYENKQLISALLGGMVSSIVSDYQTYINSDSLKSSYTFIPTGGRLDSYAYKIGTPDEIKDGSIKQFTDFCKNTDSQKAAADRGFNNFNEYTGTLNLSNMEVLQARSIYNAEKNGTGGLTVVFVADTSGSMGDNSALLNLKAGLKRLIDIISPDVSVGLISFNSTVTIEVPIAKFDEYQRSFFSNAVKKMTPTGGTALFDGIIVGEKLLTDAKEKNPNTNLLMIFLTDGERTDGRYYFDDIKNITKGIKIPIITIGYNIKDEVLADIANLNEAVSLDADSENIIPVLEAIFRAYS